MNILLTGGSGFIGKNILESPQLKKHRFTAPGHPELDLGDEQAVNDFLAGGRFDVIVHAAGKPGHRNAADRANVFYADVRMLLNLLRNEQQYKKIIILGSGAIYDQRFNIAKVKETEYLSHLPADEHALYRYVSALLAERSRKIIELRIFGIFGKYEDYAIRFISNAICKTLFDLPITIKQNRKFDYLYVNDLMPVLDYFIEHEAGETAYNVTPDQSVELLGLAELVKKVSGKDLPIQIAQNGLGLEYTGDNSRLKNELPPWRQTSLEQAVMELYGWYAENKNLLQKESLLIDK